MSSPEVPRHSRHSSGVDSLSGSPNGSRQSRTSLHDLSTPHRNSFHQQDALDLTLLSSGGPHAGNAMGNLADELADAFSDSETDEDENEGNNSQFEHAGASGREERTPKPSEQQPGPAGGRDLLSPQLSGHRRKGSAYDGSEYGSDSDLDNVGISEGLMSKISAVESLARRGTEDYGGPEDSAFHRLTDGLRELGSQSSVEASTSRLITAHSALSTHLAHQARQLHTLTYGLLSPIVAPPDPEMSAELLPLLVALADEMPRPSTTAYNSLTALRSLTADLVQTLNYLSDTLHMSRQTTGAASRRLKSVKDLVSDIRKDEELRQEGELWLARGQWGERLEKRECAEVCGEVIGGFEEVCAGWRERLLAQAETQA